MSKIAELLSSGLTITTIVLSVLVVTLWYKSTQVVVAKAKRGKALKTEDWFIIGVFIGFAGETLDNLYWLLPWSAAYLNLAVTDTLMQTGVYFNIPLRQGLGIVAAYCHIRSAMQYHNKDDQRANKALLYAAMAGAAYSLILALLG